MLLLCSSLYSSMWKAHWVLSVAVQPPTTTSVAKTAGSSSVGCAPCHHVLSHHVLACVHVSMVSGRRKGLPWTQWLGVDEERRSVSLRRLAKVGRPAPAPRSAPVQAAALHRHLAVVNWSTGWACCQVGRVASTCLQHLAGWIPVDDLRDGLSLRQWWHQQHLLVTCWRAGVWSSGGSAEANCLLNISMPINPSPHHSVHLKESTTPQTCGF